MKRVLVTGLMFSVAVSVFAQDSTKKKSSLFGKVSSAVSSVTGGSGTSLSSDEIAKGLKEALSVGAKNSADKLSAADGFFKDAAVKVLMPPEAQKVEKTLRSIGAGKLVDDAILSFNRAAEDASKSAAPIFVDAVKNMSISDALGILKGADTAATAYLRKATTTNLTNAFKPVIDASLKKVDATKYWSLVVDKYNSLPTTFNKVNSDLPSYVTQKALNGIFFYVADEEKKIRTNPAARVSDILKKVFAK
ncbi:MAG: DUF4197 domain-containing protein [Chitinophagaceae bacterium]